MFSYEFEFQEEMNNSFFIIHNKMLQRTINAWLGCCFIGNVYLEYSECWVLSPAPSEVGMLLQASYRNWSSEEGR